MRDRVFWTYPLKRVIKLLCPPPTAGDATALIVGQSGLEIVS
jgi:hypothetical protein